jgi:hypothetical protein
VTRVLHLSEDLLKKTPNRPLSTQKNWGAERRPLQI